MTPGLANEIASEQQHGRQKYGGDASDTKHDDSLTDDDWYFALIKHLDLSRIATPRDRRQHLVKVAGLAVSAIESHDRKQQKETCAIPYDLRCVKEADGSFAWED